MAATLVWGILFAGLSSRDMSFFLTMLVDMLAPIYFLIHRHKRWPDANFTIAASILAFLAWGILFRFWPFPDMPRLAHRGYLYAARESASFALYFIFFAALSVEATYENTLGRTVSGDSQPKACLSSLTLILFSSLIGTLLLISLLVQIPGSQAWQWGVIASVVAIDMALVIDAATKTRSSVPRRPQVFRIACTTALFLLWGTAVGIRYVMPAPAPPLPPSRSTSVPDEYFSKEFQIRHNLRMESHTG